MSLVILVGCSTLSCAYQPGVYQAMVVGDAAGLPDDHQQLLALADASVDRGPKGPDIDRSLAAANKILAADRRQGEAAWRAARALYLKTLSPGPEDDLGDITARCMDASAVATAYSTRAEAHYYAALCMGARAKAKKLEGLDLVPRMEKEGKAALAADPTAVAGGPHRLLGGVYLWAPAWPASIGDLDLALEHLGLAVELAPNWAENHMLLAYALYEDEAYQEAMEALKTARAKLARPEAEGWRGVWTPKIEELEQKIAERLADEEDE